ncbi:MAG: ATP-binding protein [Candidatus Altiarchaeota archaeon]
MDWGVIESTKDIKTPTLLLDQIIGQETAVEKVKLAVKQKRNLFLVGPPGIGKSMLANAMADLLPKPTEEVIVIDNPNNPNRPSIKILRGDEIEREKNKVPEYGRIVNADDVPTYVSEMLGFRCIVCGNVSDAIERVCPRCGEDKRKKISQSRRANLYSDIITEVVDAHPHEPEREVHATRINREGEEEMLVYQRLPDNTIRVLDSEAISMLRADRKAKRYVSLIPLNRSMFVQATGASETELLGDVRHDPYGSHPEIGTPAYLRVVAGAIHEAHEGVLFIDELPHLGALQTYILTAMQERKFPIVGRNPQSSGASVKVDAVPCDFLFVGACNIREVREILPPLRSRIIGNGYEILLETSMADTDSNRFKVAQFITQEIIKDGRIPHAKMDSVEMIIDVSKKMARNLDNVKEGLTLRLRDLGGILRMAGDYAVSEKSEFIEKAHVERSVKESRSIEHQLKERYGSYWDALRRDEVSNLQGVEGDKSYL